VKSNPAPEGARYKEIILTNKIIVSTTLLIYTNPSTLLRTSPELISGPASVT